ncbi:MAG: alpha/beta fold hydrolase [Myxococcales bacterium]|nr:alpha/beta fold hydrolase [Myxococcales bacterium]
MLHGNPTWSFLYRKMISAMSGHFRCVALDYPGFGLSTAPDEYDFLPRTHAEIVAEFVEKLDFKAYILVAQDWGGPIGLSVAARYPDRVRGLVIGNT